MNLRIIWTALLRNEQGIATKSVDICFMHAVRRAMTGDPYVECVLSTRPTEEDCHDCSEERRELSST